MNNQTSSLMKTMLLCVTLASATFHFAAPVLAADACDRQTLATRILNNTPNITLGDRHTLPANQDLATAQLNISDTASGGRALRSSYADGDTGPRGAPGGSTLLHRDMLDGMIKLADTYSYRVTEIAGGGHENNSVHYNGRAFDVGTINETSVLTRGDDSVVRAFRARCIALGANQAIGPEYDAAHANHVHITWPNLPSPGLIEPENTAPGVAATPTFRWSAVTTGDRADYLNQGGIATGASEGYVIAVALSPEALPTSPTAPSCPGCVIFYNAIAPGTLTFTPSSALSPGTPYYWRVRGKGPGLVYGNWSCTYSFTTQPTQTPTLTLVSVSPSTVQTRDWNQDVVFIITVENGSGQRVSGATIRGDDGMLLADLFISNATDANGQYTYRSTVPSGKANGTYAFSFYATKSGFNDSSTVNRQAQVSHTGTPDLTIVEPVVVSPTSVAPGGTIRVDWTERNQGTAASSPAHNTKIYLASSQQWGTDHQIAYYGPMNTLGVGATQPYSQNIVVLASIPAGDYYVTVFIDSDLQVSESRDDNNIGSSTPTMLTILPSPDTTAPMPNPSTWSTTPYATGPDSIQMVATTASDPNNVQYYFDCLTSGGHDSGWQDSATYQDTGLSPSTSYSYRVRTLDQSANQNTGSYSTTLSATTQTPPDTTPPTPNPSTWSTSPYATGPNSIQMVATTASDPNNVQYYFHCLTSGGHDSGWQSSATYQDTGLLASTSYSYQVRTRDQSANQNTGSYSTTLSATTQPLSDTTPPTPNPSTWFTAPYATGPNSIQMVGTTASDPGGVQYYFHCLTSGGHDSAWQVSATYQDTELSSSTSYSYQVRTRDQSANQNTGSYSTALSATTQPAPDTTPPTPNPSTWLTTPYATGPNSIQMVATTASDPGGVQYYFHCLTGGGHDSGWQASATYQDTALSPSMSYSYQVRTRDQSANQNTGSYSTTLSATTQPAPDTTPPTPNPSTWLTAPYATGPNSIQMVASTASDPSGVQYYFQCLTGGGHDSGWQASATYQDTGLSPSTSYSYQVRTRDQSANQNTGSYSTTLSATTQPAPDTTPPTPNPSTWATAPYATGPNSIQMVATTASDPNGVQYFFHCLTSGGHDSGWQASASYVDTGLSPNTTYAYQVMTRDNSPSQNQGSYSASAAATTQQVANNPPQLSGIAMTNGLFRFMLNGPVGSNYVIQVSSDLVNWLPFSTNVIPADGFIIIIDTNMVTNLRRFYRAAVVPPAGMALIPPGSFQMGDSLDGDSYALPSHTVYVSEFSMDKYEVTKALWDDVYNWAITHDYSFDYGAQGKASNHPAHSMTWYDAVKWCNARSEKEGKTPAYYTDAGLSVRYRSGQVSPSVNWSSGYRLPTEAEWEKATRGGASGQRFPWSDTDNITHSRANYYSTNTYAYDTSSTRGFHPTFNDGVYPYTSPVGYFAANGYGLYDMAGNVWEWCWDWHGAYSSASQTDPRGPTTGSYRVLRGGCWIYSAFSCRAARRNYDLPTGGYNDILGFRSVLPPGQ